MKDIIVDNTTIMGADGKAYRMLVLFNGNEPDAAVNRMTNAIFREHGTNINIHTKTCYGTGTVFIYPSHCHETAMAAL